MSSITKVEKQEQLSSRIAEMACNYDVFDFVRGQADCHDGVPHKDGNGVSYDAGYRCEYEIQQINSKGFN